MDAVAEFVALVAGVAVTVAIPILMPVMLGRPRLAPERGPGLGSLGPVLSVLAFN